jgi:hypothetical protein
VADARQCFSTGSAYPKLRFALNCLWGKIVLLSHFVPTKQTVTVYCAFISLEGEAGQGN